MINVKNGNATINIFNDGTRIIKFKHKLSLDYPLNIDIRVSTFCSLGYNKKTGKSICSFCHESATTNGIECDYDLLKQKLEPLPFGIELAIGVNKISQNLIEFLNWCKNKGFICNVTINQLHINSYQKHIEKLITEDLIKGLGVSYRNNIINVPESIKQYENTVLHVINGIDSINEVIELRNTLGIKKILILGEKDFGFNKGNVDLESRKHREWFWWVSKLFNIYEIVSFDNLALEQLNIKRFFDQKNWDKFYQMENSLYINAVDGYLSPSSRSYEKVSWNDITIKDFFLNKINNY